MPCGVSGTDSALEMSRSPGGRAVFGKAGAPANEALFPPQSHEHVKVSPRPFLLLHLPICGVPWGSLHYIPGIVGLLPCSLRAHTEASP